MKVGEINQSVSINCTPLKLYNLLLDSKQHSKLSNSVVQINKRKGGKFSIFDGYCDGYNIELIPGTKIVQAWNFKEDGWPEDHYSICTFKFSLQGDKTKLIFHQTNIPEHKVASLKQGWKRYYWEPLKAMFK